MSALSDLQKKLEQEAQGIMFPFSAKTPTVDTKQEVYNSATDGIMTMQGQKYIGPDAVIQYGSEEEGFARQLKQIEAPMLPQFDETQFPKAGEGIVETPTPPIGRPVEPEQPTQPDQPAFDPCPPGFKFDPQLQRCVPIEKQKSDRQTGPSNPPRNIGSTAKALDNIAQSAIDQNLHTKYGEEITIKIDNSTILSKFGFVGKLIDQLLIKGPADDRLKEFGTFTDLSTDGINITQNKDGTFDVKMNEQGKYNFGQIQTDQSLRGNLASTQKTDKSRGGPGNIIMGPNNTPMIVGPISVNTFGVTSPTKLTPEQIEKNRQAVENAQKKKDNLELTTVTTRPSLMGQTKDTSKEAREFKERFGKQKSQQQLKQERDKIESDLDDLLKENITEADRQAAKGTTGSSANKSPKGKIVCTMMNESYGFGSFRNKIWLSYAKKLTKEHEVGYHTLFLPLVKYAKQKGFTNNIVKKVLEHIAIHRTIDIRKQKYNKVNILGRTYRTILEPLCYITGGIKTWKKK
tara:strand:+ start:764 stop:2314 length:1551 start_codon:yes stop_codon:yes gene_type:complete